MTKLAKFTVSATILSYEIKATFQLPPSGLKTLLSPSMTAGNKIKLAKNDFKLLIMYTVGNYVKLMKMCNLHNQCQNSQNQGPR